MGEGGKKEKEFELSDVATEVSRFTTTVIGERERRKKKRKEHPYETKMKESEEGG